MFVEVDNGMIAMNQIKMVHYEKGKRSTLTTLDGETLRLSSNAEELNHRQMNLQNIPASPGYFLVNLPFPEEVDEFVFSCVPIVAWRLAEFAAPLTFALESHRDWAVLCPDGRVIRPDADREWYYENSTVFTAAINKIQTAKRARAKKNSAAV